MRLSELAFNKTENVEGQGPDGRASGALHRSCTRHLCRRKTVPKTEKEGREGRTGKSNSRPTPPQGFSLTGLGWVGGVVKAHEKGTRPY